MSPAVLRRIEVPLTIRLDRLHLALQAAMDCTNSHLYEIRAGCWLAVASADHVRRGRSEGFMQVGHGKGAPLKRIKPGDGVVYYSPTTTFGGKDRLRAFTAIGVVREGDPYAVEMGPGATPYRRDVAWSDAEETPIRPLLDALAFTAGKPSWGYQLRFGLFAISRHDFRLIERAMRAQ